MARYTAEQIYAFAREAGFDPDQATTMTAIAMAESGGDSNAHATHGENSMGLWQVNMATHPEFASVNLYDPLQNAKAAFQVSDGGRDVSPWTTTHGGLAARYLRYKSDAQAAALAYGDGPGHGMWSGTTGYGDHVGAGAPTQGEPTTSQFEPNTNSATTTDGSAAVVTGQADTGTDPTASADTRPGAEYGIPLDEPQQTTTAPQTTADAHGTRPGAEYGIPLDEPGQSQAGPTTPQTDTSTTTDPSTTPTGTESATLQEFLHVAVAQTGDRYEYGAPINLNDPHPSAFDCSELVVWSSHQVGVSVPFGAWQQYTYLHQHGDVIPVDQAINTPGALLFSFSSDPNSSDPVHAHVAISLGNGKTIEALGAKYGVGSWDATTKRFQYAAVIPGISDQQSEPAPAATDAAVTPASDTGQPASTAALVDDFEYRLQTDPGTLDSHQPTLAASAQLTAAEPGQGEPATADHVAPAAEPVVAEDYVDVDQGGVDDALDHAVQWPTHDETTLAVDHHDHGGHDVTDLTDVH